MWRGPFSICLKCPYTQLFIPDSSYWSPHDNGHLPMFGNIPYILQVIHSFIAYQKRMPRHAFPNVNWLVCVCVIIWLEICVCMLCILNFKNVPLQLRVPVIACCGAFVSTGLLTAPAVFFFLCLRVRYSGCWTTMRQLKEWVCHDPRSTATICCTARSRNWSLSMLPPSGNSLDLCSWGCAHDASAHGKKGPQTSKIRYKRHETHINIMPN